MLIGLNMSTEVILATLILGYTLLSVFVSNNKLIQVVIAIMAFVAAVM
jgi:hypothetical protein